MIRIYNSAKLPYSICKGSIQQRNELADKLLSKYLTKLNSEIKNGETTIGRVKENIKSVLPVKNIMLDVIPNTKKDSLGYVSIQTDDNGIVQKYIMALKTNSRGKIDRNGYSTLVHEAWHFFEFICNPKLHTRFANIRDIEKLDDFYERHLYNSVKYESENKINKMIKKILKKYTTREKIDILQNWRYYLSSEGNARIAECKYVHGLQFKESVYKDKIQILNNFLKKVMSEDRH